MSTSNERNSARRLIKDSVQFNVAPFDNASHLIRTTIVESTLPENPSVIFHHDIQGRPYDDGCWFVKHNAMARPIGDNSMEVTITSQYPPDETIFFSWAVRPGLFLCGGGKNDCEWPIVLSGVLAPECRDVTEISRTIDSSHLPKYPAISFRMMGDASGYASGETVGSLPVAFPGIANVQAEVLEDNMTVQVTAKMLEGNWPIEGAIAWTIRSAPTFMDASSFRGVFGCTALAFEAGSRLVRIRVNAGMKLPENPFFVAAPLEKEKHEDEKEMDDPTIALDWEPVDDYSFMLVGRREVVGKTEEACTVLVDWEFTTTRTTTTS